MADTKPSAFPAVTSAAATDQFIDIPSGGTASKITFANLRSSIGSGLSNASTGTGSGYSTDTYLAGSAITIPTAGGWRVGTQYHCEFDMGKTAAGTSAFVVTLRLGTLGTTGDAALATLSFGAGTAAVDQGWFKVSAIFYAVGSGTSALVRATVVGWHHLAATGLFSTGASGFGWVGAGSAGFNSTTQTIIGVSVNGQGSFSGTNTHVAAWATNI